MTLNQRMKQFLLLAILATGCTARPPAPQATATIPAMTQAVATTAATAVASQAAVVPTATNEPVTVTTGAPATAAPAETPAVQDGLKTYHNPAFGLSFQYPAGWFGPDEYIWNFGVRTEIGTDVVYPYGTSLEDRHNTQVDAYYIVIDYRKNLNNWTLEQYRAEQSWLEIYFTLLEMSDGEVMEDQRSQVTRVRELQIGRFTGVEYLSTLSDTAQTERFYSRSAILFDEDLNLVQIMAQPSNVAIVDPAGWKADYQRVHQAYLEQYNQVLQSITVE